MLSKGTLRDLQENRAGILGGHENDAPGSGVEESKDEAGNLLAIAEEVKANLPPGQEATLMSPEDVGKTLTRPLTHQVAKAKSITRTLTHEWLLEHDEDYRTAFHSNLQARNTANMKKYQVETVFDDGSSGTVKGSDKKVTQPVTEMSPRNDSDISKNRNNNVRSTDDGTDKSGSTNVNDKSASTTENDKSESTTNSWVKYARGNPKSSKNRNNNVSSTTDGTEKSISTEGLITRLHKMDELHKMKEDLSFATTYSSAYMQGCFAGLFAMVEVPQYTI
jgi:hypothetical protein